MDENFAALLQNVLKINGTIWCILATNVYRSPIYSKYRQDIIRSALGIVLTTRYMN